jgi:uncharacterized repeat protein (TIGR03803 family)
MRGKKFSIGLRALAIFAVTLLVTSTWAATNWNEKVRLNFNGSDGVNPVAGLIFDAAGNLYGTTYGGGTYGYGTVFELTPNGSGGWTQTVLYSFGANGQYDGANPYAGLIFDAAGNLYGTTYSGGTYSNCVDPLTCGTVFELTPTAGGGWTETTLYSFSGRPDGSNPGAGLILDAASNLYGTTLGGGAYGYGTVFELTPTGGGNWSETVLHSFGNGTDGYGPWAGLIFDAAGNLYGTTTGGGANYEGTVFELTPTAGGGWTEQVLYNFNNGNDGWQPYASLIFDAAGNLYGTTTGGGNGNGNCGNSGCGTAFELTPTAGGGWTQQVLHNFNNNGPDGWLPYAGVIFDDSGNLYGTTFYGGTYDSCPGGILYCGMVFELTPTAGGTWTERVLYNFGSGTDGANPAGTLIFDAAGNLYGPTYGGGTLADGTVFELTPVHPCAVCSHAVRQ